MPTERPTLSARAATLRADRHQDRPSALVRHTPLASDIPFAIVLLFVVVSLLNLGVRYEWLAPFRPTVVFVAVLSILAFATGAATDGRLRSPESKLLGVLIAYALVSIPFVTYGGSVVRFNLEVFVRSAVFFFFVAVFVDSERRLMIFLYVYVCTQLFRALEPLYLHVTEGYWGGKTYLGEGEFMGRLAGVPSDTLNPNGLGFLTVSILPLIFYWAAVPKHWWRKIVGLALSCTLFYVLILTSSRSAMVALVVLVLAISVFVRRRLLFLGSTLGGGGIAAATLWSGDQLARFEGLLGGGGAGSATAQGRIDGILSDVSIWLQAPIFGHGLGTSFEANWNIGGSPYVSHNIYTESLVTLGIVGALIFFRFLYAMFRSAVTVYSMTRTSPSGSTAPSADPAAVTTWLPKAMICLLAMYAVFGLSSYGVTEYYCYLFAGLCVVLNNLAGSRSGPEAPSPVSKATPRTRSPGRRDPRANA